ncbi:Dual specificity protein phosphatase 1B [Diplonema papillatum]|nr:Dual specificity protein phosphatase 1B [Diplonema papillatum]
MADEPSSSSGACVDVAKEKHVKLYNLLREANASKYVAKDPTPGKVEEGLYVGSIGSVHSLEALQAKGITHVLSLGNMTTNPHPLSALKWKGINVSDTSGADLAAHFEQSHAFILEGMQEGGILVHCHQGKSRSVTVVASFLMRHRGKSLEDAMATVRAGRPQADPNVGFTVQLLKYQRLLNQGSERTASSDLEKRSATDLKSSTH